MQTATACPHAHVSTSAAALRPLWKTSAHRGRGPAVLREPALRASAPGVHPEKKPFGGLDGPSPPTVDLRPSREQRDGSDREDTRAPPLPGHVAPGKKEAQPLWAPTCSSVNGGDDWACPPKGWAVGSAYPNHQKTLPQTRSRSCALYSTRSQFRHAQSSSGHRVPLAPSGNATRRRAELGSPVSQQLAPSRPGGAAHCLGWRAREA